MKASELIEQLQKGIAAEGDLQVFSEDMYLVTHVSVEDNEDAPEDYNMPSLFFMIKDFR